MGQRGFHSCSEQMALTMCPQRIRSSMRNIMRNKTRSAVILSRSRIRPSRFALTLRKVRAQSLYESIRMLIKFSHEQVQVSARLQEPPRKGKIKGVWITSQECDHVCSIWATQAGARSQERGRQPLGSCPSTTLTLSDLPLTSIPKLLRTPRKPLRE